MPVDPSKMLQEIETLKEALKTASGKEKARLLEKMGDIYADSEKMNKAEICYMQAMEAGEGGIGLIMKYVQMLSMTGQANKGAKFLDDALGKTTDSLSKAELLVRKSVMKYFSAEYEESRRSAELAMELLEKDQAKGKSYTEAYGNATNIGGLSLFELGRCEQAIKRFDTSTKAFASYNDYKGMAKAKANKALVLIQLGKYDEAIKLYDEAVELDERSGGQFMRGHCQNNIGMIWLARGDFGQAEERFMESNRSYAKQGYPHGIHLTELNLMDLALERGDLIRAAQWSDRALKGFQSLKEEGRIAWVKIGIARLNLAKGDLPVAEKLATDAVKGAQRARTRETEAYGLRVLGTVELKKGDKERAETLIRRGLEIFKSTDHMLETGRTLKELAVVLSAKGSMVEAQRQAAEARKILESIGAKVELERLDKEFPKGA